MVDAGGSGGGPDNWLLLDGLADASADGDGAGQGGGLSPGLNAGQAVDMLLGEPGASAAMWITSALAAQELHACPVQSLGGD